MAKFLAPTTPEISARETRHMDAVRALASECMVLLRNDGTLPLKRSGKIALFGNGARATVKGGTGSGDVYVRETVNVEEGLKREGFTVTTKNWIDRQEACAKAEYEAYRAGFIKQAEEAGSGVNPEMLMMLSPMTPMALAEITEEDIQASDTDTAVYVLSRNSGEGKDRLAVKGDYELSEMEVRNLEFLSERYEKLIVLLNIGGVIDTKPLRNIPGINAVVLSGQMGNITGLTVADLLLGKGLPSGKLTDTWAENYMDYPSSEGFGMNDGDVQDEYYTEGIYTGYRYFDTFNVTPAYEFGFGLNYTDFEIRVKEVRSEGTTVTVAVDVQNTGKEYPGKEVVQLYVSAPAGHLDKPYQELRAFAKTKLLAPGESETLTIAVSAASFASYCERCASYVLEPGDYIIRIGNSSRNTHVAAVLTLDERTVTEKLTNLFKDPAGQVQDLKPSGESWHAPDEEEEKAAAPHLELHSADFETKTFSYQGEPEALPKREFDHVLQFDEVAQWKVTEEEFIQQLSDEELAFLCVGNSVDNQGFNAVIGAAAKTLPGAAGETTGKLSARGLRQMELCDGPAGLRLTPEYIETPEGTAIPLSVHGAAVTADVPDGIHHYQYLTAIPIATQLASSWDLSLVERCGDIVGTEMEEFGATLWLAPGMNIHRNPLCGRNFEYYSEDPLLAGKCAAADTIGVQKHPGFGTTIKHYLANSQEDNRMFTNSHISERAIREIYARNFRIAVQEAQPMSVMTSYNLVNGVHAANNKDSVTRLLRDEWGFEGMVMTDWLTTSERSKMLSAITSLKYDKADPAVCVLAQNDLIEPGEMDDYLGILDGLKKGIISRAHLEVCAGHILRLMLRTHLYANKSYYAEVEGQNITFTTL